MRVVLGACVFMLALVPGSPSAQSGGTVDPLDVARGHVDRNAARLGVSRADVGDLFATSRYRSSHSGITHVNLNQRFRDLEVFGGQVTVNVADDGRAVFAAGSLVPDLAASASGSRELRATEAVEAAAKGLGLDEPSPLTVIGTRGKETVVSDGGISDAPIPVREGWQPTRGGLRLAWQLVIDDSSGEHLWNATVDAQTGRLLASADWTSHDRLGDLASTLTRSGAAARTSTSSCSRAARS
jgi:extracellular elastinolytic metalloproteinase